MPITGITPGTAFFDLFAFEGLSTQATRSRIKDQEFSWLENFLPIGKGNLRTIYGRTPLPIFSVSQIIPPPPTFTYTYTADQADVIPLIDITAAGWNGSDPVTIIINENVHLYASSPATHGFDTTGMPAFHLINHGLILGAGGNGGHGNIAQTTGTNGGPALKLTVSTSIVNSGTIGGGGGGGGGGSVGAFNASKFSGGGGGGGGGAGWTTTLGGGPGISNIASSVGGTAGAGVTLALSGGHGGNGGEGPAQGGIGGLGGGGGAPGAAGATGGQGVQFNFGSDNGGSGGGGGGGGLGMAGGNGGGNGFGQPTGSLAGLGGNAVDGFALGTWQVLGTIYGATV